MIDSNRPKIRQIMNLNRIFHFYYLNMDFSVTIYIIKMKFSVCIITVLPEGRVSQIFDLGPSFHFMAKNG